MVIAGKAAKNLGEDVIEIMFRQQDIGEFQACNREKCAGAQNHEDEQQDDPGQQLAPPGVADQADADEHGGQEAEITRFEALVAGP